MATALALTDAYVYMTADLSDWCSKVEFNVSVDDLETTAFGATYKTRIGGLKDGSVSITFNQDFTNTTGIDDVIWPLLGTVQTLKLKATSGAGAVGNPMYYGPVLITEWKPLGNSVGDLATVEVTWPTAGAWTRSDVDV